MTSFVPRSKPAVALDLLQDPIKLTQDLIQCPSVTPQEGGALDYLETCLIDLGFTCHRLSFSEGSTESVDNLFALYTAEAGSPHFCFAGHTDVVPAGDLTAWQSDPFQGTLKDDHLYGRGAVDMKGSIACFVAALGRFFAQGKLPSYSISLLITGDEEGIALNGTRKVLTWLEEKNIPIDFCLVGEPTCHTQLGDTIKIGRRGSLNTHLTVQGKQGHVAFPDQTDNPVTTLVQILNDLKQGPPENKSSFFDPSNLEVTSIDVNNDTTNLIPNKATARFNIRFNDQHTGKTLSNWIHSICKTYTQDFDLNFEFSGEAEFVEPNETIHKIAKSIEEVTGLAPSLTRRAT